MGVLGADLPGVDALEPAGGVFGKGDAGGGDSVAGSGHARGLGGGEVLVPGGLVDDLDLDGVLGAGVDAGGLEAIREAAAAHVTFADDAALGVELGDAVGAVPDAILAADAGVGGVDDDAGEGVLGVGVYWAAANAVCVEAVVAGHGKIGAMGVGEGAAFELADAPPLDIGGVAVLLVAGDLTGAAADALGHVEVEAVLLAGVEGAVGDEGGDELWGGAAFEQSQPDEAGVVCEMGVIEKGQGQGEDLRLLL